MSSIRDARLALYEAENDAKMVYDMTLEAPRQAVKDAVVTEYVNGSSVSSLCREYGTTARVTIIDILKDAGVYQQDKYRGGVL